MGSEPTNNDDKDAKTGREPGLFEELLMFWRSLPDKWLFGVLALAWVGLFHFWATRRLAIWTHLLVRVAGVCVSQ
jgi:hypothetical protein